MRRYVRTFRLWRERFISYVLLPAGGLLIVGWVGVLGYLLLYTGRPLSPVATAIFIGFFILLAVAGVIVGFWRASQALWNWPKRRLPWPMPL